MKRIATVLLVEDNLANIKLMKGVFRLRANVELVIAENTVSAVVLAEQKRPDLILLDLHLPDFNGHVALERIQELPNCKNVPVIVVTADITQAERDRLKALGAWAYITKPFNVPDLLQHVDLALRKEISEAA